VTRVLRVKQKAAKTQRKRKAILGEPLRIHPPTPQMGGYSIKESLQEYGLKNTKFTDLNPEIF
jgi:hypothetical protein